MLANRRSLNLRRSVISAWKVTIPKECFGGGCCKSSWEEVGSVVACVNICHRSLSSHTGYVLDEYNLAYVNI